MECKFCNQPLAEGETLCPHCGKDNAEETVTSMEETVVPMEQTEIPVEDTAAPAEENEAPVEETAASAEENETPEVPQPTPIQPGITMSAGKLTAIIVATALLVAALVAMVFWGMSKAPGNADASEPTSGETVTAPTETAAPATVPADGNPDDVTCKGTYTVTDEEAIAQRDVVVATIGEHELTNADLQIYYWLQVQQFLSEFGSYISYVGLDYSLPLDTQICSIVEEGITWQQYFLESALATWQNYQALSSESVTLGYEIDETILADIDNLPQTLQTNGVERGFETAEDYLAYNVGPGSTVERYMEYLKLYYQGYTYFEDLYNQVEPSREELEAFFDSHADDYAASGIAKDTVTVDVRHVLIMPEGADSSNIRSETFSDEAWAWAEAKAQELLESWKSGEATEDTFAQLANENSSDSDGTDGGLYTGVTKGQMVEAFDAWCFDEAREFGDVDIVKTEFGYHIMFFVKSEYQWVAYAQSDFVGEKVAEKVLEITNLYPLEVAYDKIVLGLVSLA